MELQVPNQENKPQSQSGKIGYLIAWLMGVPASVLLVIYLIFGR